MSSEDMFDISDDAIEMNQTPPQQPTPSPEHSSSTPATPTPPTPTPPPLTSYGSTQHKEATNATQPSPPIILQRWISASGDIVVFMKT